MTMAACIILITSVFSTIFHFDVVIQHTILCTNKKLETITLFFSKESIFLLPDWVWKLWQAVSDSFGSWGRAHKVTEMAQHNMPRDHFTHTLGERQGFVHYAKGAFAMLIYTQEQTLTFRCINIIMMMIYNDARTFSSAIYRCSESAGLMWRQQWMQGLCSIHHMLSLSQRAKWFY